MSNLVSLRRVRLLVAFSLLLGAGKPAAAQTSESDLLSPDDWKRVDSSVDLALGWLASQQQSNGSFPTMPHGQPGVTSLCVMAFVAHGHLPGEGEYGAQLSSAVEFILGCQKPNGLLALVAPSGEKLSRNVRHEIGSTAAYNHALSSLLVSELYAMGGGDLEASQVAIEKAIKATLQMQSWPKTRKEDAGGWRYINRYRDNFDSDLSVTGWNLMFLRSAKNSGFDIAREPIEDAVKYVQRCYNRKHKTFVLMSGNLDRRSRGMAGAGILAMAHSGLHDSQQARDTGEWLLREGFPNYNESRRFHSGSWTDDRYHYGVFVASQAMYQLGGKYWREFYPPVVQVILDNQNSKGHWADERSAFNDSQYGNSYTTALMALTLGTPNQLLPIFQR